ncbi:hypothetical protein ACS0TY_024559 [Phlomoides rotata]
MKKQLKGGRGISTVENLVVKGLHHKKHISIDWTSEEQSIFEYLDKKYASEISIVRYASIAQALPDKNIQDVVFRSRWMKEKKNRKREDISSTRISLDKSIVGDNCGRLIERNAQLLDQIDRKFPDLKIHENTDLLSQARANILTILNNLPKTFHNKMPPFPFKINQELTDSVLPPTSLLRK